MKKKVSIILFFIVLGFSVSVNASQICGVVVNTEKKPLSNVLVRWQATEFKSQTNENGVFCLEKNDAFIARKKNITAALSGYYMSGQEISAYTDKVEIILKPVSDEDNKNYRFLPSFESKTQARTTQSGENNTCEKCHPDIVTEFKADRHSQSAQNDLFQKMFTGVGEPHKGFGYKKDFPTSNGNCASCHQPVAAINQPYNTDPLTVSGVAKEGVACDFCHKIKEANINRTGGHPGVLSYQFARPHEGHQTFYGPLDDIHPGEDSYNPLYAESRYCAPCHNGKFWNTLVYSEFKEWEESEYAQKNITCQKCHMPAQTSMTHFALPEQGGHERDPATLISHKNLGITDEAFMKNGIDMKTTSKIIDDKVHVSVAITNTKAGHHYPTGNPMRNMLLVVETKDNKGNVLSLIQGSKIPEWGGKGDVAKGYYAGQPGKGFAKVLANVMPYPGKASKFDFSPQSPSPHWRPTYVHEDTRIAANQTDVSEYIFDLKNGVSHSEIQVSVKLIYRRMFKSWQEKLGVALPDLVLSQQSLKVQGI